MRKPSLATVIVAFLSLLLIPASMKAQTTGFGVTDYDLDTSIHVGESKKFEIARLYNTGHFDLIVTSRWVPNYGSAILVEVMPNPLYLIPGESAPVYVKVTGGEPGEYDGFLDFNVDVKLPENYTGSPSVPGGRAHAVFNVVGEPPTPTLPIVTIMAGIIAVIIGTIAILILIATKKFARK